MLNSILHSSFSIHHFPPRLLPRPYLPRPLFPTVHPVLFEYLMRATAHARLANPQLRRDSVIGPPAQHEPADLLASPRRPRVDVRVVRAFALLRQPRRFSHLAPVQQPAAHVADHEIPEPRA